MEPRDWTALVQPPQEEDGFRTLYSRRRSAPATPGPRREPRNDPEDWSQMVEPPAEDGGFEAMVEPPESEAPTIKGEFGKRWVGGTLERLATLPERVGTQRRQAAEQQLELAPGPQTPTAPSLNEIATALYQTPDEFTEERYGQTRLDYEEAKQRFLESGVDEGSVKQGLRVAAMAGIDMAGLAAQQVTIDALISLPLIPVGGPLAAGAVSMMGVGAAGGGLQAEIEGDLSVKQGMLLGGLLAPAPMVGQVGAQLMAKSARPLVSKAGKILSKPVLGSAPVEQSAGQQLFGRLAGDKPQGVVDSVTLPEDLKAEVRGDVADAQTAILDDLVQGRIKRSEAESRLEGITQGAMDRLAERRSGFSLRTDKMQRVESAPPRVEPGEVSTQSILELSQQKAAEVSARDAATAPEAPALRDPQSTWMRAQQAVDDFKPGRGNGDERLSRRATVMGREIGLSRPQRIFEEMVNPEISQSEKMGASAAEILRMADGEDFGGIERSVIESLDNAFSPEEIVQAEAAAAAHIRDYRILGELRDTMIDDHGTGKLRASAGRVREALQRSRANDELMGGPTADEGFVTAATAPEVVAHRRRGVDRKEILDPAAEITRREAAAEAPPQEVAGLVLRGTEDGRKVTYSVADAAAPDKEIAFLEFTIGPEGRAETTVSGALGVERALRLRRAVTELHPEIKRFATTERIGGSRGAEARIMDVPAQRPLPDIGPEMGIVGAGVKALQPKHTIASRVDPAVPQSSPLRQWLERVRVMTRSVLESASAEGHATMDYGGKPTFLQRITGQRPSKVLREQLAEGARQPTFDRKAAAEAARLVTDDFTVEMERFISASNKSQFATEGDALKYLTDFLEARNDGSAFPPNLRSLAGKMRKQITAGSERLQDLLPDSMRALKEEIAFHEDDYLHRPMQLFHIGQDEWRTHLAENWQVVERYVDFLDRVHSSQQMPGTLGLSAIPREDLMARALSELYIDPSPVSSKTAGAADIIKRRASLYVVKGAGPDEHLFLSKSMAEDFANRLVEKTGKKATLERRVMPQEFDDFFGLDPDPLSRVMLSVGKQAQLAASIEYLNEVRSLGLGKFLSDKPSPVHNTQVGGPQWSPVRDLYAKPEEAAVFREFGNFDSSPIVVQVLESIAAAPRRWRTVLNWPQTHIRNAAGYIEMLLSNGKTSGVLRIPRAAAAIMEGRVGSTAVGRTSRKSAAAVADWFANQIEGAGGRPFFKSMGLHTQDDYRWFIEHGIRRGIFREGALTADIMTQRRAAKRSKPLEALGEVEKYREGVVRTLENWYIDEDDIGRGVAWMAEAGDLAQALGLDTTTRAGLESAFDLTAPIVRDVYPSMSKAPRYVEVLRRIPVVSDFPTFHAEMLRTSKNIPRQAIRELADRSYRESLGATTQKQHARIQRIGARRMAGFVMTNTVGRRVLRSTLRYNAQTDERHEDLARMLGPEFWEHSDLVVVGKNGKTWRVLDGSYSNPRQWAPEVWHAAMQKGNPLDVRALEAAEQLFEPFHALTMAGESAFYLASGQTKRGERLWVPGYPTTRNIGRVTSVVASLAPGVLQTPVKVAGAAASGQNPMTGYPLTLRDELVAQGVIHPFSEDSRLWAGIDPAGFMIGSRVLTLDIEEAFQAKVANFTDSVQEAQRNLARDLRRSHAQSERFAAKSAANGAASQAWEDLRRIVLKLIEVGFDYDDLSDWRKGRISQDKLDALIGGEPPPVDLTPWPEIE